MTGASSVVPPSLRRSRESQRTQPKRSPSYTQRVARSATDVIQYFEDFHPGQVINVGSVAVTDADIIAFARQYDPQPMHIDPEAARRTIYGGLIASGWHTVSLFMRLLVENLVAKTVSLGSPGVDELRWPLPVRPGDRLSGQMEVLETRASSSRPTMGIVRWRGEVRNQDGQLVMSLLGTNFFGRRPG